MARASAPPTAIERLADHIFDGASDDLLAQELVGWLAGSARFRAFADAHRDKIRKKLRGAMDDESRRDVRAELRVAHLLLADRRIELGFEAYGSGRAGPDFSVTFRRARAFNLEVTRLRRAQDAAGLARPLLGKLRQLPPSAANALLVAVEGGAAEALDVTVTTRALRARADMKDEAFFAGRGFEGTREFYERFLRLGAVVVWCEAATGDARAALWSNGSARIAVPAAAVRACMVCLRAG
jgi:hypothetical protein